MSDEILQEQEKQIVPKPRFIDANPVIAQVYNDTETRFKVLCSGRQLGKTTLAAEELIRVAISKPNSISYAVAPTNGMVRDIFYPKIKPRLDALGIPYEYLKSRRKFILKYPHNKSEISLKGADDPDRLRGGTLDFVALDEYDYMEPRTWFEVLLPTLAVRKGKALFTSTPKGYGYIKELYEWGQKTDGEEDKYPEYKSWLFFTSQSPFISKEDIARARSTLDPKIFRQEYEASFEVNTNRVAYNFEKEIHVREATHFPNREICIGCDFNVNPMSWVAFQIIPKRDLPDVRFNDDKYSLQDEVVVFLKEWKTANCNTGMQCELLKMWLKEIDYKGDINFYGDASGDFRHSGQTVDLHSRKFNTDWEIIKAEFENGYFYYNKANPIIKNRVNAMNAKFLNANNEVGILIDTECRELIKDFMNVSQNDDGRIDKSQERKRGKIGHLFDAATYPIYYEYDLSVKQPTVSFI